MRGVDISHYQRGLKIQQIKDAGNDFAIIKLTEGAWLRDGAAFDFYREAYEIGFPVGCYCYSHATTPEDAWSEAQFLLNTLNKFPMPCGIFLDIEEPKQLGLTKEKLYAIVATWCNAIQAAGYIPGVYGSEGTIWTKLDPNTLPDGCLVWVAKWGQTPPNTPCDLWQTSDKGSIEGFDGAVDTDVSRGNYFEALVQKGYSTADACPIDGPCEQAKPDASGAFKLLAEYMQTEEFQQGFLTWAGGRHE